MYSMQICGRKQNDANEKQVEKTLTMLWRYSHEGKKNCATQNEDKYVHGEWSAAKNSQ